MNFKVLIKTIVSILVNNFKLLRFQRIGHFVRIQRGLTINGRFKEKIFIGNNVHIGRCARLGNTFNFGKGIIIGNNVDINNYFTAIGGEIIICSNCSISSNVTMIAGNHDTNPLSDTFGKGKIISKTIFIGENCWIGDHSIILGGVTIGEKSIIGAGSVVTKDVPSYSIAVGNPAKVIKKWNFDTNAWERIK